MKNFCLIYLTILLLSFFNYIIFIKSNNTQNEIITTVIFDENTYTFHEEPIIEMQEDNYESLGIFKITAYCSCKKCTGSGKGITASGAIVQANHTVAAPPNFPFGTILLINGIEYTVEDRGGAIKGNRLDIYFDSHEEALQFGVKYLEVFKKIN